MNLIPRPIARIRDRAATSPTHDDRTLALLGLALGVSFTVCFLTGLLSHLIQHPPGWFTWPSRPAGLYRVTQGLHVATGLASVPLLLAKLWAAGPKLVEEPVVRDIAHALERLSLLPLVGGSLFLLITGVTNITGWYPYPFSFPPAHYAAAWITIGALVIHIVAKITTTRDALRRTPQTATVIEGAPAGGLSRRGFVAAVAGTAGIVTLTTIGQTFGPLRNLALLAPRRPDKGPQGLPVNKTAAGAGIKADQTGSAFRLVVEGRVGRPLSLSLAQLRSLPQRSARLPISCVEGWSGEALWGGVAVKELLAMARAPEDAEVTVESLQAKGSYRQSELNHYQAADADSLLALDIDGEPLHPDHGFPLRLICPNRPGVQQTKWVHRLVVR